MNISAIFIRRPIMTTLVMFSILLFGVIGYIMLPVSDLPNVDMPVIMVSANLPGASPDTMASSVATPLEKEFSTIAGVDTMTSSSTQGATRITLQFVLSRSIDAAAQDVQAAIARAVRKLPANMPAPPSYRKVNPADQPILYLTLTSRSVPMAALDDLGQVLIGQRISMVAGVAQVNVYGSQKYAVRIEVDPKALAAREIGIDDVANVISAYNVNLPLGMLTSTNRIAAIYANGQLLTADRFMPLIVAYRNGQPVRLRDIGTAVDSVENDQQAAWYVTKESRDRAIVLAIQKQPGTNTVEVADAVKALLPSFKEKIPAAVSLAVLRDASDPIKESFNDVKFTLFLTLILVVLVIFLFLRNLSATIIPSMTLPMSLVGTFAVMYLLQYSLDNLSLMALTLSVGFVVDDAIVMLENCVRHMEMGKSRRQAAFDGSREIGFTIVSMTLSLAAVFIPVIFMPGIVGRLFREFSITIGAAVLVSGFVSLTLTPMMCSKFLRDPGHMKHGLAYRVTEMGFQGMLSFYNWSLRKTLQAKFLVMAVSMAILVASIWILIIIPKDFVPNEDRDQFIVRTEGPQDTSFEEMAKNQLLLADMLQKDPSVEKFMCSAGGGGGSSGANTGMFFVVLRPRAQRKENVDQIIERLRPQFMSIPDLRCYPQNIPPIPTGSMASKGTYQYTLYDPDTSELFPYAEKLEGQIRGKSRIFQDVSSDLQMKNPELDLEINRDQAFTMGVTPLQIETALYGAYGTEQVSTIFTPNNDYQVILELKKKFQTDPSVISYLYIHSSTGALVPLKAVVRQKESVGPLQISHSGQLPSVTISFNLKPGVSLGEALTEVETLNHGQMPSGMSGVFQGTAASFKSSLIAMLFLFGLAVAVIYIVLGILYESFYHPWTILSALPFALFGALLTLLVFNVTLSLFAFIGIIMLVGLVKKNGIIMIDFALEAQRKEGKNAQDAIHEACMVRFRPIMMTTMAALMAGLPIALGLGAGAESRRPLGLAVVGGLLFSQTLTLYVTPVIFVYMEKLRTWIHGADAPHVPADAVPQAAGE